MQPHPCIRDRFLPSDTPNLTEMFILSTYYLNLNYGFLPKCPGTSLYYWTCTLVEAYEAGINSPEFKRHLNSWMECLKTVDKILNTVWKILLIMT
jgi:hypothetical protein